MYNPKHALEFVNAEIASYKKASEQFEQAKQEYKRSKENRWYYKLLNLEWRPGFMDWINWYQIYLEELLEARNKIEYAVRQQYTCVEVDCCYWYKFDSRFYSWYRNAVI